ncbi:DUF883 family protein [Zestomonas thermotolerans]|jgi:ElaB/YqjD/DUF883 family membrane-anchored ribosome-binding protein|uniref:DUF883 family protein n=1 Tax=Zestomonas thermotolerans TaxID=157784 RepID=UPI000488D81C|nr:DUF883 family protein [Pseudomonas thermotolerans]
MPRNTATSQQDALLAEFKALVADTEKLLQDTAELAGAEAEAMRAQVHDKLKRARETLQGAEQAMLSRGREALDSTEAYVAEHPWHALGIAAGIGFLLGLLSARR